MTSLLFLEMAVSLSVQASLIVVCTRGLCRCVSESVQCRLWTTCYALLLLLLIVGIIFPHPRLMQPWMSLNRPEYVGLATIEVKLGWVLFCVWFAGTIGSLLLFVYRTVRVAHFLKKCEPVNEQVFSLQDVLPNFSSNTSLDEASLGGKQTVRLLSSSVAMTPFCWQFHQPCIVIPKSLLESEICNLQFIVRHEIEHLRTGHPLQLFLQQIVEAVFWYHPMIWWASNESTLTREFACDDAAIDSPNEISNYLRTLLTIVEFSSAMQNRPVAPLAFGRGQSMIASRSRRLVKIAEGTVPSFRWQFSQRAVKCSLVFAAILTVLIQIPVNVLASPRSHWSPWPTWTADTLHDFGIQVRDFEVFDQRLELRETMEDEAEQHTLSPETRSRKFHLSKQ